MSFASYLVSRPAHVIALLAPSVLLGALAIDEAGYPPCTLCLYQRVPYYLLCALLLWLPVSDGDLGKKLGRPVMWIVLLVLLVSALLGTFHAGVEFGLWEGLKGCSGKVDASSIDSLLSTLRETKTVSCTKASFWIFGLSLSVWNVIVSVSMAAFVLFSLAARKQ